MIPVREGLERSMIVGQIPAPWGRFLAGLGTGEWILRPEIRLCCIPWERERCTEMGRRFLGRIQWSIVVLLRVWKGSTHVERRRSGWTSGPEGRVGVGLIDLSTSIHLGIWMVGGGVDREVYEGGCCWVFDFRERPSDLYLLGVTMLIKLPQNRGAVAFPEVCAPARYPLDV